MTTSLADDLAALAAPSPAPLSVRYLDSASTWTPLSAPSASIDERFEIGSVTKALTGSLFGILVHAGEVDPDEPVDDVTGHPLPWRDRVPSLLDLATHHAGLPNTPRRLVWREAAVALGLTTRDPWRGVDGRRYRSHLERAAAKATVGTGFGYSSMGTALLSDALSAATSRPFARLLHERLLSPLGMHATGFDRPEEGAGRVAQPLNRRGRPVPYLIDQMPAAGGLASTTADLARLLDAVRGADAGSLAAGIRLSVEPRRKISDGVSIGYCWLLDRTGDDLTIFHTGGTWGSQAHVALRREAGRAMVALSATYRDLDGLVSRYLDSPPSTRRGPLSRSE